MINIILCGVGGQGTVLASKILASAAGARGESAHTAETIGMAQRGGSVVSHVRIGEGAYSPLIAKGCADAIIAFEPAEAVRAFPYLKKGGSVTVSSSPVKPVTDSLADKPYSADDMIEFLEKQDIRLTVVDGGEIIREAGSAKSLNAALIAAACASAAVPFSVEEIENVVRNELKAEYAESNLRAIAAGARAVLG